MWLIGVSHTPVGVSCFGDSAGGHDILSWLSVLLAWLLVEFRKAPQSLAIVSQQFLGKVGSVHSCPPAQGVVALHQQRLRQMETRGDGRRPWFTAHPPAWAVTAGSVPRRDCRAPLKGKNLTYSEVSQVQNQIDWGLLGSGHQWGNEQVGATLSVQSHPCCLRIKWVPGAGRGHMLDLWPPHQQGPLRIWALS